MMRNILLNSMKKVIILVADNENIKPYSEQLPYFLFCLQWGTVVIQRFMMIINGYIQ